MVSMTDNEAASNCVRDCRFILCDYAVAGWIHQSVYEWKAAWEIQQPHYHDSEAPAQPVHVSSVMTAQRIQAIFGLPTL